jgi:hypothetical protein
MTFAKYRLRFIDSLHFFLCPLADLSKTYSIDTVKGFFPHHFNRPENQTYKGKIPSENDFGVGWMSKKNRDDFLKWYNTVKNDEWDFQKEFLKYCQADVDLLAKAICKFRAIFKNMLDVDPFRYVTLASLCKEIYINKFIPENTIVGNASNKPISQVCKEWLIYLNNKNIVPEVPVTVFNRNPSKFYKKRNSYIYS